MSLPTASPINNSIFCPQHPNNLLKYLCLKQDCTTPYICPLCKPQHPNDHKKLWITLKSLDTDQTVNNYAHNLATQFSAEHLDSFSTRVTETLTQIEDNVVSILRELKEKSTKFIIHLSEEVQGRKKLYTTYIDSLQIVSSSPTSTKEKAIHQLVDSYRLLKEDNTSVFDFQMDSVLNDFKQEMQSSVDLMKGKVSSIFETKMNIEPIEFGKLKSQLDFRISTGFVSDQKLYAYIEKWNVLATTYDIDNQNHLGFYEIRNKGLRRSNMGTHQEGLVNHMIWIDQLNYVVLCSSDKVEIIKALDCGRKLASIAVLQCWNIYGYSLKYLEDKNILVIAGRGSAIQLWNMGNLRKCGKIKLEAQDQTNGSIAYIKEDNLIGLMFDTGFARFYHVCKGTIAFTVQVDQTLFSFRTHSLQYLPKTNLIVANVSRNEIQVWKYVCKEFRVQKYKKIDTQFFSQHCVLASKDERYLYYKIDGNLLVKYDIEGLTRQTNKLPNKFGKSNYFGALELGGILVADSYSGDVSVLH